VSTSITVAPWQHAAIATASLLLLLHLPALCAASDDKVFSICELAANPMALRDTTVRVKGIFETDESEFSGLHDARCPGVVMGLYFPRAPAKRHRSVNSFDSAVDGDVSDLRLRRFEVEFTGTFHWDLSPGPRELHNGLETPRGSLEMRRVWTFARWRS
jgi:hypothetical protein